MQKGVCLFIRYHSVGWDAYAKKGKLSVFRASRYTRSRNLRKIIQGLVSVIYSFAVHSLLRALMCSICAPCLSFFIPPPPPLRPLFCRFALFTKPRVRFLLLVCQGPQLAVDVVIAVVPFQTYKIFFFYPLIDNIIRHRLNNGYVLANAQRIVFVE